MKKNIAMRNQNAKIIRGKGKTVRDHPVYKQNYGKEKFIFSIVMAIMIFLL